MNEITLDELGLEKRISTRKIDQRQENFDQNFDSETFCYDIFSRDGRTIFISPPNDDNAWSEALKKIKIDGFPVSEYEFKLYKNKIHKLIVNHPAATIDLSHRSLSIKSLPKILNCRKRVLYTLQRDNDIRWIIDWVQLNVARHKINCVVIYDNNSTVTDYKELFSFFENTNIELIVKEVPFKYGPEAYNGSGWDSDFLQYAMFEHVRYYCCNPESIILNSDIDEIVITANGDSVFNMPNRDNSVCLFYGKWVVVQNQPFLDNDWRQHSKHNMIELNSTCPTKWVARLDGLSDSCFLRVHEVAGISCKYMDETEVLYLHHKGINNNWKYNRGGPVTLNAELHRIYKKPEDIFYL
jgi:hypothetical protein